MLKWSKLTFRKNGDKWDLGEYSEILCRKFVSLIDIVYNGQAKGAGVFGASGQRPSHLLFRVVTYA